MDTLDLTIHGQIGEIDATALQIALNEVVKLLRVLADGDDTCLIRDLRVGSAQVCLEAPEKQVQAVCKGLESLEESDDLPDGWNGAALRTLLEMKAACSRPGVEGVSLGIGGRTIRVTPVMFEHARAAQNQVRRALGSVKGVLYSLSAKDDKPRARMTDARTGKVVQLVLKEEQVSEIVDSKLMKKALRVWGVVERDPLDNRVISVEVEGFKEVGSKQAPHPAFSVQGILGSDWLDGKDPVDIVREQRGA